MTEQLAHLQDLVAQLHEINQEFTRAAEPLYQITDPNDDQQKDLRTRLMAAQARWESVTKQISQVLGTCSAPGLSLPNTTKAARDEHH
jgi:ABC-type transporter Mla subunit MlaD